LPKNKTPWAHPAVPLNSPGAPHSELRLGAGPTNERRFLKGKKNTKTKTHQNGF